MGIHQKLASDSNGTNDHGKMLLKFHRRFFSSAIADKSKVGLHGLSIVTSIEKSRSKSKIQSAVEVNKN